MKNPSIHRRKTGFTLIELLTVIAIIGVLAAIIIPAVGGVLDNAKRSAAQASLKGIAIGYKNFATGGSRARTIINGGWQEGQTRASNSGQWAQVLADFADVNEAPVYFIDSAADVAGLASIPKIILAGDPPSPVSEWSNATQFISYNMAINIPPTGSGNVTPVIWTKGLQGNGSWSNNPTESPWGSAGGHIAFADGHVEWFDDTENQLIDPANGNTTSDIGTAVGGSGNIVRPN